MKVRFSSLAFLPLLFASTVIQAQLAVPVSVSPSSGSGSAQLFAVSYSDSRGGSDVLEGDLDVMSNVVPGTSGWSAHECIVRYDPPTNAIYLVPDAGGTWIGPITAGTSSTLSNSQCTVMAVGSSKQVSGATLTVNFLLTFTAAFAGAKQMYMESEDGTGHWNTNYTHQFGSFTVTSTSSPLFVSPVSGSGTNQVFGATFYDPNGGAQIKAADLYVMSNVAPGSVSGWSGHECILEYDVAGNNISQVVDAGGSFQGSITAGSNATLANSQCTIFASASSATVSGNMATVYFAVQAAASGFTGGKQVYLATEDTLGHWSTNYQQQFGSWIIPTAQTDGPPSIPNSFTAGPPGVTCSNIAGTWFDADNFGNSIRWDLNQAANTVSGTLSFDDYRDFGTGLTFCGTITYQAAGQYDGGDSFSLTASHPSPCIDACGLPVASSETENITLSGNACGTGTGAFSISSTACSSGGALVRPSRVVPKAQMKTAQAVQASGSSSLTTVTPRFSVQYASYIPVDNIHGPTPCIYIIPVSQEPLPVFQLYKGDAFRGTYRTTQSILVVPDKQVNDNFFPNAGPTRNYGFGSPVNGSTLDSTPATSDIYNGPYAGADEDNVQFDCFKWNDRGKADTGTMQGNSVSFPSGMQAKVNLSGLGQDPLEPKIGGIKWNATVTIDDSNSSQPTASVNITHTCYPAHIVKVNGTVVYSYLPPHNNTAYLLACLTVFSQVSAATPAVPVPNH